jgi:hypothetical protein
MAACAKLELISKISETVCVCLHQLCMISDNGGMGSLQNPGYCASKQLTARESLTAAFHHCESFKCDWSVLQWLVGRRCQITRVQKICNPLLVILWSLRRASQWEQQESPTTRIWYMVRHLTNKYITYFWVFYYSVACHVMSCWMPSIIFWFSFM